MKCYRLPPARESRRSHTVAERTPVHRDREFLWRFFSRGGSNPPAATPFFIGNSGRFA
nr:MAG TPA: hypothetical protein [Caudoviricetes sp.]